VTVHQEAHNELLDCGEAVMETKKVDDFLKGIQDQGLQVGKTVVLSDPLKLGDFEACQQYLSTLVANMSNQSKSERNVSSTTRSGGGDNSSLIDKIKGGQYTDAQFRSFSKEEKDRVARYREETRNKKKSKRKFAAKKRKLAKAQSEREAAETEADGAAEETTSTTGAGAQFGGNGNRAKKSKH
jgi:hypothetical protein